MAINKFISLALCVSLAVSMMTAAVFGVEESPVDEILQNSGLEELEAGIGKIISSAVDDTGSKTLIVGENADGLGVWITEDGEKYDKYAGSIEILALEEKEPDGTVIYLIDGYEAFYYDGSFYILVMITADGDYIASSAVLLRTADNRDYDVISLPEIKVWSQDTGIILRKCGEGFILAAEYGEYVASRTASGAEEYASGVYYTSSDLVNWVKRTSPEKLVTSGERYFMHVKDMTYAGSIVFEAMYSDEAAFTLTGDGYFYTEDHTAYHELSGDLVNEDEGVTADLSFYYSANGETVYSVREELVKSNDGFLNLRSAVELWRSDGFGGEWTKLLRREGEWLYNYLSVGDDGACLMIYESEQTTHMYRFENNEIEYVQDESDIVFDGHASEIRYSYNGNTMIIMKESNGAIVCTADSWNTYVRINFPGNTCDLVLCGDMIYFFCDKNEEAGYICSAAKLLDNLQVEEPDVKKPGDANGDGSLNLTDVSLVLKHIAGWNVSIDEEAADVDDDGHVKIADASLMLKAIAGWNVELK